MKRPALSMLSLLLALMPAFTVAAKSTGEAFPRFEDTAAFQAALDESLELARAEGRLLMVVLGANWCHDSEAFVDLLDARKVRKLVRDRYVVQNVDIGYYENVREIVGVLGVPVIYGTPTAFVFDPESGALLNRDTLPLWRNAALMDTGDAIDYFDAFEPGPPSADPAPSPALAEALAAIDTFETRQAERIFQAWDVLGPEMRDREDILKDRAFQKRWDRLAAYRGTVAADVAALREDARAQDAAGVTDIRLVFPDDDFVLD